MKKTFQVDKGCIENGIKDSIYYCPVATAIKKIYRKVEVTTTSISFGHGTAEILFENTEELEQWIRDFDDSKKVQEMQVCLDFEQKVAAISSHSVSKE